MKNKMGDLKIVVLESPYDTWKQPQVEKIFCEMIGIKLRGYGVQYPYGVLPVDGADLISTHLLLCHAGSLHPIMGIRWTSLNKCKSHYIPFPALSLVQQAGAPAHVEAMEELIKSAENCKSDIYYSGALTIDPKERHDKEWSIFCREVLTMMYVCYQREHTPSELIAGGTLRFKIQDWLRSLGHTGLSKNGIELGPINVRHLAKETVQVMHMKQFSFEALRISQKWESLWENKLLISPETNQISKKKAA